MVGDAKPPVPEGQDPGERAAVIPGDVPVHGIGPVICHPRYTADVTTARDLLTRLDSTFDLAEPFVRIREAVAEARKLGAGR